MGNRKEAFVRQMQGTNFWITQPSSDSLAADGNSDWSPGLSIFSCGAFLGGLSGCEGFFLFLKKNEVANAAPKPTKRIFLFFMCMNSLMFKFNSFSHLPVSTKPFNKITRFAPW